MILILAETGFRIGEVLGIDYTKDIDYQNRKVRVRFREDNENGARAKNFEFRESIVSNDTFEFLMHYLAENRKLLQYQKYLFEYIAEGYINSILFSFTVGLPSGSMIKP